MTDTNMAGLLAGLELTKTFPLRSEADWRRAAEAALKGGAFDRLISKTADGLALQPLYPPARGDAPVTRGHGGAWTVSQRVDHPDPSEANRIALADLENGASGLTLVMAGAATARGYGLAAETLDDLDRTLEGVMLDLISLRVEAGPRGRAIAATLTALAQRRKLDPARLHIEFGGDPISHYARTGRMTDAASLGRMLVEGARGLRAAGFRTQSFIADGRAFHEAGAGEAQELACVLASAVQTMRMMTEAGFSVEAARDEISFLLVADADQFLTLAKFRALRRLWARVEQAMEIAPKPISLHAETAWRMTTKRDPWVNLLRATVAVFSAGVGGADSVTVLPFTAALGLADDLARRIARNTQLVLLEESNLARVADPAAGAGGIATLTDELCEAAWRLFQQIEREGGLLASLGAGAIQSRIAASAAERAKSIARRKIQITGTSEFPDVNEAPVDVLHVAPPQLAAGTNPIGDGCDFAALVAASASGARIGDLALMKLTLAPACQPLPCQRDGAPFEALRDEADAQAQRPTVFLANLGPVAAFTARATFAKNVFEAGGIAALSNDGFADDAALVAAFKASGAKLACLCSSDALYGERAVTAAKALAQAGAQVALAGRPGELEAALKEAGVSSFIFAGCDLLATLKEALAKA